MNNEEYRPPTLAEKLWCLVEVRGEDECWIWQGSKCGNPAGRSLYGQLRWNNRLVLAHRVSYCLHNGDLKAGELVLHTCDNGLCVNPKHLFTGDHKRNSEDMVAKGRNMKGKHSPRVYQMQAQMLSMRAKGICVQEIAAHFGVSGPRVTQLTAGREAIIQASPTAQVTESFLSDVLACPLSSSKAVT